jgi:hypothetical protein
MTPSCKNTGGRRRKHRPRDLKYRTPHTRLAHDRLRITHHGPRTTTARAHEGRRACLLGLLPGAWWHQWCSLLSLLSLSLSATFAFAVFAVPSLALVLVLVPGCLLFQTRVMVMGSRFAVHVFVFVFAFAGSM